MPLQRLKTPKVEKKELPQEPLQLEQQEPPPPPIRISALVVSHNRVDWLRRAIESLECSKDREKIEILVIDNGSADGSTELESEFPNTRFIRLPRNFGLTKALNIGVRAATGEYIAFFHEDTQVAPDTLSLLASELEKQSEVGAVCPLLVTPEGPPAPQIEQLPAPGHTTLNWSVADPAQGDAVEYARGAAIMVRKFFFQAIRHIDERYGNWGSDAELCFQVLRSGKRVLLVPSTRVIHEGRVVTNSAERALLAADFKLGMATYLSKHYGFVRGILFRIGVVLAAFAGIFAFQDLRYRFSLFIHLWNGQKVDGTQRD